MRREKRSGVLSGRQQVYISLELPFGKRDKQDRPELAV